MHAAVVAVTATPAVLVDGSNGSAERPLRVTIHPASSTIYLGGGDVDASTKGYALASSDAPLPVVLVSEKLWARTASGTVQTSVLISGA